MLYKISNVEVKTSKTGKTYKTATANDIKVSVWPDFPDYERVTNGSEVEGVINTKGQYSNLVAGNLGPKPAYLRSKEKEQENIGHNMDRKEISIRLSSTIRMATDMVVALSKDSTTPEQAKTALLKWRKFFVDNWDNISGQDLTLNSDGSKQPNFAPDEIDPNEIDF